MDDTEIIFFNILQMLLTVLMLWLTNVTYLMNASIRTNLII